MARGSMGVCVMGPSEERRESVVGDRRLLRLNSYAFSVQPELCVSGSTVYHTQIECCLGLRLLW
jgi:hypothetical protein